jgi:hypothetical protein
LETLSFGPGRTAPPISASPYSNRFSQQVETASSETILPCWD